MPTLHHLELHTATVPLAQPYAVATYHTTAVELVWVRLVATNGHVGLGAAGPEPQVNGETAAACAAAVERAFEDLRGHAFAVPGELAPRLAAATPHAPGARAALDMALHDLWGRERGHPVVDLLGRAHRALPTSVTIGVHDVAATLAAAERHLAGGFRRLKVKTGTDVDLDVERCARLRERFGHDLPLLVDANTGYTFAGLQRFLHGTRSLALELVEQPLPPAASAPQAGLDPADVARLVADESLHDAADAARLAAGPRAFGAWNVKLMKCGGITPARAIAAIAGRAGIGLMWGCMDESVVGIAAALHAAFACPATRWLDLDGSFDLAHDLATGGFALRDGLLQPLDRPGLGVELRPA
ncbi:MAG: dipeptide epimerase [Planctomycetes bacterium]|nr:dipeptide epimerase [Planctomycetota bacterium]